MQNQVKEKERKGVSHLKRQNMVVQRVLPRLQNMPASILTRIRMETQYHLNLTMQKLIVKQRIQGRLCFICQTQQRLIKFGNG